MKMHRKRRQIKHGIDTTFFTLACICYAICTRKLGIICTPTNVISYARENCILYAHQTRLDSVLLNINCNDKGECLASYICHCYAIREGSLCLSRTVRVFSTVVRLEIHTFEYKSSLYCWNNVGQHSCAWVDLWSSDVLFMSEQFERVMTCSSLFSHQQQHHTVYPALMVSAKDSLCVCVCVCLGFWSEVETPTIFRP